MWYLLNTVELLIGIAFLIAAAKSLLVKEKSFRKLPYALFFFSLCILSFVALSWSIDQAGIVL